MPARVVVSYGDPGEGKAGVTWCGRGEVVVREGLGGTWERGVVLHELGHVVGLGHTHVPGCAMLVGTLHVGLCGQEVEYARGLEGEWDLVVTGDLTDSVVWAAGVWNEAAGREVFVVSGL